MSSTETAGATPAEPVGARQKKRSLIQLLAEVPTLVRELVAGEIELLKQEMIAKLKALGIGAALLVVALVFIFGMIGVLLTAAVLGLATTGLPGWLSALIIAAVLLIIAVIFGLIGYSTLKKGIPPIPKDAIAGVKKDLNVIKGVGKRE